MLFDLKDYINTRGNIYEDKSYIFGKVTTCYADKYNQCVISYDGTLFKCTARDFSNNANAVGYVDDYGNPIFNSKFYHRFINVPFDNVKCKVKIAKLLHCA